MIEGSIQVSGETIRLTVRLVNAADGYHLWSEKYDRPLDDIFAVQDEIAQAVVRKLKVNLLEGQEGVSVKDYTLSREAYDCYLRGLFLFHHGGRMKAIEFYEKAIEKDPQYALAYAGLADAWIILPNFGPYPRDTAYKEAKRAAIKALELGPGLAETHIAYGLYLSEIERDRKGELEHLRKAVALKPGYGWAHHMLAYSLFYQGQIEEGLDECRRALDLDPLSCGIWGDMGGFQFLKKSEEASDQLLGFIKIHPLFRNLHGEPGFRAIVRSMKLD